MPEQLTSTSVGGGEYEEWNRIWSGLSDDELMHYRRTPPVSFAQLAHRCYFEDLWAMMGRNARARCLEMGAGRGTTATYLAAEGCDVTLLDLAPQSFALAERNFRALGMKQPTFVAADATNTGLPADSYDVISSIGLLEHFDDPKPLLVETLRLLRPGGLAFHVVVPSIPERRMVLAYALMAPWKLPPRRLKDGMNRLLGRRTKGTAHEMTRTEFEVADYQRWLAAMPVTDVTCIPYNCYHAATTNRRVERWLGVPVFRAHRAVKRLVGRAPWARTSAGLAMCALVAFRKPTSTA